MAAMALETISMERTEDFVATTELESASPTLPRVAIEIEADSTLGYASIQNSVPVVRSLRITSHNSEPLEGVEVLITCNPHFAQGIKLRFDRLAPSESRRISPVDLHPDHTYLAELQESVNAVVNVSVLAHSDELGLATQPVEVLAYDQWAGTRALPELLAAFCMPNNPAIDGLIGKASKLLRSQYSELSMDGYQSKSRDVVWKQVSALYSAISAEGLQYVEPPASFGSDGQKIRTPERILEGRVATCLDLTMLFASCLEQAGLRPVALIKGGHAWVGVWLHAACFPDPLIDDVQAIRKRVDSGEFLVFETTGVAQHHSHRPSLRIAMEQGHAHLLEENTFRYAVDIHRAREVQIKPLPSRSAPLKRIEVGLIDEPMSIEPTPDLPPLDPEFLTPLDLATEDTPEGRLSKWKSRLLDLTLRNRLLNFKPTKATLQFVAPDIKKLEDALADGTEFRIRPLPGIMEGNDPRMAQVHTNRVGRTPVDDMALEALANKELLAKVQQEALDGNLLAIFSAARTGLEEGGANTLYLAIGLLRWTEAEKADTTHLAPILLVPVSLQRQSVRSGFRLSRHDDEAIINPTLLQLLKSSFELRVAGLDSIPKDEHGADVAKILQSFRLAVREIPKWEVVEQVHLGIFSFTKYLMWKDLQDRTEQLKESRVVKHLIEHPGEALIRDVGNNDYEHLDNSHRPQDILAPLLSDSSQLKAICVVDAGRDLVLEGPPGTGKSQTITNLIAHCLAKGKTVLFVSEKMAALEVVHRRLTDIGLGPFCLELHSSKTKKSDVLAQLGRSLDIAGQRTADDWIREAERLAQFRQELNGLVDSLHRRYPSGLTVFEAIGTCIENAGKEPSEMPWPDALTHDSDNLDQLRETARRMSALAGAVGQLSGHPFGHIGQSDWSPTWQDNLLSSAHALDLAITLLKAKAAALDGLLGQSTAGLSLEAYARLDILADVLLAAPKVPTGLARHAHDPAVRERVHALAKHGASRTTHWNRVGTGWKDNVAKLNATELQADWSRAASAWWPKSVLAMRAIRVRLQAFRDDGERPSSAMIEAMLPPLADVNEEDQILRSMHADAEALLQDAYAGIKTDWSGLTNHEQWAKKFSDVTLLLAGDDPKAQGTLRSRLQLLVADDRAMLAANGPVGGALIEYRDAWREFCQKQASLDALAKPLEPLQGPSGADAALARIQGVLTGWQISKGLLQPWCLWRKVRDQGVAQGLQGIVSSLEIGAVPLEGVEAHFEFSYRYWWLKKTIDNDPLLRGFSSADHERKIREFRLADARFQKLTEAYIVATLAGRIPAGLGAAVSAESELGKLRRELQKQRRQLPVRQLVQGLPTLLPKLKPCLLMSPLSVAQYLDSSQAQFDLVVFDEASQIPVWDAVGAIARGRQLVVVGDPKQLPPTNFFNKSSDTNDDNSGDEQVEDLESILDECLGVGMNQLSLQWHYRSKHESLITFSNVNYYESSLITFPSPVTDDVAVRFERVAGVYDRGASRTNRAEAEAIVNGIESHFLSASKKHLTLGVVTFNQPQQALIETLLDARRGANQALDRAIAASSHEPLFIKNLENVQGDERDVIFFSITYGPDAAGKTTMNFGPLNGEGGQRRLNVAISRAREGVVIYSSLMPEQIDLAKVRAAGVRDLKHYLEFALKGPRALVERSMPTGLEPDSPFETAVIKVLRDRNWVIHPQVGCSGYRIDMGVVDPRSPGRYLVGVECDGRAYHSGASARDRDRLRQHVLEGLGWRIHRIWSTDWWLNPEVEVEKLVRRLQELLASDEPDSEEPQVAEEQATTPSIATNFEAPVAKNAPRDAAASYDVPTSAGISAVALPVYSPAILPIGNSNMFYEPSTGQALAEQIRQVVEAEGPLPDLVLYRRVARAWGLERTGSRIVERLRNLVPSDLGRTSEGGTTFYWPASVDRSSWKSFRLANNEESSRRRVDDVCIEELGNLVLHVLDVGGSAPRQDVSKSVCRLLGMARTPADAEARVQLSIDALLHLGVLADVGGSLRKTT
ncbi:MAG: DNA helicase [Thiomonas sp. 14-64-326]|nr:MAG: DNA helicase [Thiomonas sp. 14-64-326]